VTEPAGLPVQYRRNALEPCCRTFSIEIDRTVVPIGEETFMLTIKVRVCLAVETVRADRRQTHIAVCLWPRAGSACGLGKNRQEDD
jgi:hypothetical protein